MYVQMLTIYSGPSGVYKAGQVVTVSDSEGEALVNGGYGVEVSTPDGLPAVVAVPQEAVTARIDVGAEVSDVREINIDLFDSDNNAITTRQMVHIIVFADIEGENLAETGGSTGLENVAEDNGKIVALVAKKVFVAFSNVEGHIEITWTDAAGEVAYLGVVLPDGSITMSSALTTGV